MASSKVQDPAEAECAAPSCSVTFVPKRKAQRYHSATCRQRGHRGQKQAEAAAERESRAGKDAEHPIVAATRRELEGGRALNTLLGQIAMETANRAVDRSSGSYASMIKLLKPQVREAIDEVAALNGPKGDGPDPKPPPSGAEVVPDALRLAREARDRAREAAGTA